MCHALPWPLAPRVFPILLVTAKVGKFGFVVVQVPVTIGPLSESFYSNGRNIREGDNVLQRKKPILGYIPTASCARLTYAYWGLYRAYTSIERCRMLPDETVEWTMTLASDAKGWLPTWVQKMGLPAAIVKDVGLFMKWAAERRESDPNWPK